MKTEIENLKTSSQFLKTDGKTKSNAIEIPSISLPKGGGAIKGIDEKFSVNSVNGTASFSIPLPLSPTRGSASPALNLDYNSGAGNGIFGLGWTLSLPSIKRKTDKGLPQYLDDIDSDTFLFSGAEDLVPEFAKESDSSFSKDSDGNYIIKEKDSQDGLFTIKFYRPRIEGLFARIERWSCKKSQEIKWRVISKENITTLFGWSNASRISDPEDPYKIFEWLPEFTFDDKGNCTHYIYKKEDDTGYDTNLLHNRNRTKNGRITYTNMYLERILYGNKTPYGTLNDTYPNETEYMFRMVFDYGEYDLNSPYTKIKDWDFRLDAFSEYKAGFEIRTTRLCKRVLLFHNFTELTGGSALVKSINFGYDTNDGTYFTFLNSITSYGYIKKPDGSYTSKNLPPIEFEYQKHQWNKTIKSVSQDSLIHAPEGLNEPLYQFIDLFSEGLPGILTDQGGGLFYKRSLGCGLFEEAKLVSQKPSFYGFGSRLQLLDLDADGSKQLVSYDKDPKGYFELSDNEDWQTFRTFKSIPNIDIYNGNTRMIDLNGDGKPEILITEDHIFTWYESVGRRGFESSHKTYLPFDEEEGPYILFADPKQTVFLADMSGDGLADIVRIRNKEICYWPNLGYGRFGAKVSMDHAPDFDHPDAFNPAFLRLADIDGSGTTDIIYLGKNKFTCYLNQSGNAFSDDPFEIDAFQEIHNHAKIMVTDLLGNGIPCIVWSSPLSKDAQSPLKYIDLMDSKKPHIMVSYKNNLGKEIKLEYEASTMFYIKDRISGRPCTTKLHFPVHCISKIETRDRISGYRFVSSYKYHHGYYDHEEREFRGFGMVEQTDTEDFEHWIKGNSSNIVDKTLHQETVITKSWFHTGAFFSRENILNQFAHEYWYEEMAKHGFTVTNHEIPLSDAQVIAAPGLDPTIIEHLEAHEWREALRACKGASLHQETFSNDAPSKGATPEEIKKQLTPYLSAMRNYIVELLQPKGQNKHAIFVVKEKESISYSYERNTEDPRISHTLNIKIDQYGNVLESASVVYPRIKADYTLPLETQEVQSQMNITYIQNKFTNDIDTDASYRLRLPSEVKTYELKGVEKNNPLYSVKDFNNILTNAVEADYHEVDKTPLTGTSQKRLIEYMQSIYRSNNLKDPLPLYHLESLALPFESYQLAYTSALLENTFGTKVNEALMLKGKFTRRGGDGSWWIPSGSVQFMDIGEAAADAKNRFYLPVFYTDPYGTKKKVKYDNYKLFIEETEDALGNKTKVELFNFRTLSPQRMNDPNNNISEAIKDELGLLKAFAVFGKGNEADDLNDINEFSSMAENTLIDDFFHASASDVLVIHGKKLLQHATKRFVYDLEAYKNWGKPVAVTSIVREEHYIKNNDSSVQISFEYSSGLGHVVMKKVQAEPGPAKKVTVNSDDSYLVSEIDTDSLTPKQLRWIGSGRTVLNNKGNAVKQYEPYFSVTHKYEDLKELVEIGVTPIMYYDAQGRLIKTQMPDGTLSCTEFDSWKQIIYDLNDTILTSSWYENRTNRLIDAELLAAGKDPEKEKSAADKASKHANTPTLLHFDTLGRPVLYIDHNKHLQTQDDEFYHTRVILDIEGNLRKVIDARGNMVMQYKYDMLGNKIYQHSMDAGQRWMLSNILGNPLRAWDEKDHEFQYFYDILHRPTHNKVIGGDGDMPLNHIFERVFYGELETNPELKNLRGQVIKLYDTGGILLMPEYDFKGQPKSTTRKLCKNYKDVVNWIDVNLLSDLESDSYTFITETDALGRIAKQTAPDGSVITPIYNETGLLRSENVAHAAPNITTRFIKDIGYNEKGQRNKIIYGNDVVTRFFYDKETFRLTRLQTKRQNGDPLQDWHYTYDPVGNITHIEDQNVPIVFFDNQKITGISTYTYDALYRLAEATGRENTTPLAFDNKDNWNDIPFIKQLNPGDPMTMRNFTQSYLYDSVGNILKMRHLAAGNNWTRDYNYNAANNRLLSTQTGTNNYSYQYHPQHGYIISMPHLEDMEWNFKELLVRTVRQRRIDGGTPETTYYQYDGQGQRIRKITENQANSGDIPDKKDERIYIEGYEIYKQHSGVEAGLERISLSLMDKGHRFVMIDTETKPKVEFGITMGRTAPSKTVRYQLHNHLGSAALELDDTARVISYEEYHPYGTTAYQAKNADIQCAAKRYRYTGMERDEESGLEYHSARYYLPWLGRWTTVDPILNSLTKSHSNLKNDFDEKSSELEEEESDTSMHHGERSQTDDKETESLLIISPYAYSLSNPINNVDIDGKQPVRIGYIYTLRTTIDGKTYVYSGQTARQLAQRLYRDKHKWREIIRSKTTTIEAHEITAQIRRLPNQTARSAVREALSAGEQVVIKRRRAEPGVTELNEINAAREANIERWAEQHSVRLGARFTFKTGVKVGAFAGFMLLDAFLMYRDEKISKYVMSPYVLEDEQGIFTLQVKDRGIFRSDYYFKNYKTGSLVGQSVQISKEEFLELQEEAELLWGKLDWKGDWVPGLLRQELPEIDYCTAHPDSCA
ncbi:SpvB/TcaC N-terminal domain-containing protein [Pseudobacteroides cellulosolvens]|uniref:RHS repeat-associated core domain containing protein-containing protein n=1 Tax=Pseudobacteroides cellulosolvens ATCC 35603 = DSM 2933 TaxID=398512 RepID=A0A0L6JIP5_9FIRM|nr:SpvB/TcaC N-terminal domain-containing protein [Pseudobacteroides cellulosolvens]KNY25610.1 RHS repeat-associated core domain containing protein-containing protein [Pseudobacteroides cellulosolvens ATCC 35603 = DSM 2933]